SVAQLADGGYANVHKAILAPHFLADVCCPLRDPRGERRVFPAARGQLSGVLEFGHHLRRNAAIFLFGLAHQPIVLQKANSINPRQSLRDVIKPESESTRSRSTDRSSGLGGRG